MSRITGRRFCYYATRGGEAYEGRPHVVIVTADEPGYALINPDTDAGGPCRTMAEAEQIANFWNKKLGVDDDARDAIVTSSMRCFDAGEADLRRKGLRQ